MSRDHHEPKQRRVVSRLAAWRVAGEVVYMPRGAAGVECRRKRALGSCSGWGVRAAGQVVARPPAQHQPKVGRQKGVGRKRGGGKGEEGFLRSHEGRRSGSQLKQGAPRQQPR